MLYHLAKHLVSASLVSFGLLAVILSLFALLRICRRPILKLPTATLVVLSIFAVISASVADKTRSGTQFPSRQAPGNFIADLDIEELGEIPPASNLCISAILRGTNSTDILISLPYDRRPVGEKVDVYAATDLTFWDWIKPYSFDVSSVVSNILVSVTDDSVSTNGVLPMSFYSVGDAADSDCDGAPDSDERFLSRTDPSQPDTDADGFNDGWEIVHASLGYDPLAADTNGLLAASADLDGDGLTNADEAMLGTDLSDADGDTDDDGVPDAQEVPVAALRAQVGLLAAQFLMSPNPSPSAWNLLPALAGVTNPNSGNNSDYVAIGFFFGDPSSSHSEKYCLVVSPRPGSGLGIAPETQTSLNESYGVCDMKLMFLKKGWKYDVTLRHAATNISPASDKDPDYALLGAYGDAAVSFSDPDGLFGVVSVTDNVFTGNGKTATITVMPDTACDLVIDNRKSSVILYHNGYYDGVLTGYHAPMSTTVQISAKCLSPVGGELTLRDESDSDVGIYSDSGCENAVSLPFSWTASTAEERIFYAKSIVHSSQKDDVVFTLSCTACDVSNVSTAKLTVVEVSSQAISPQPANRSRHVFGVCEEAKIRQFPSEPKMYCAKFLSGGGAVEDNDGGWSLICPQIGTSFSVECITDLSDEMLVLSYSTVLPEQIRGESPHAPTSQEYSDHNKSPLSSGEAGVVMMMNGRVNPCNVSFYRLFVYEGVVGTSERSGCFLDYTTFPEANYEHSIANGACANPYLEASAVGYDNTTDNPDFAGTFVGCLSAYSPGSFSLGIPVYWYCNDSTSPTAFPVPNTQTTWLYSNGTVRISKCGVTWERDLDGTERQIQED